MESKAWIRLPFLLGLLLTFSPASADQLQCPNDIDKIPLGWVSAATKGLEDIDHNGNGLPDPPDPNDVCMWIQGGDGFSRMGDGYTIYTFGFSSVPLELPETGAQAWGALSANGPAPSIVLNEGQELYLNLGNTGFHIRPDVADPHTVHWHGFPEQSAIHDGVPELSPAPRIATIFPYWYQAVQPGTYFYHCHFEAPEHIELGMIGNLYVKPAQNGTDKEYPPGSGRHYTQFAYNDGDGRSGYDVDAAVQSIDFDRFFHDQFRDVQPDPFYNGRSGYPMINGRGYPDTVVTGPIYTDERTATYCVGGVNAGQCCDGDCGGPAVSCGTEGRCPPLSVQTIHALVEAAQGQKILLRLSNVSIVAFHTITVLGIPMRVIGKDAKLLRGPTGLDLSYEANSITYGGGESYDVLLDTGPDIDKSPCGNFPTLADGDVDVDGDSVLDVVPAGTYFLYSRNLNDLNNFDEARGGMMTEIRISACQP